MLRFLDNEKIVNTTNSIAYVGELPKPHVVLSILQNHIVKQILTLS